MDSKLEGFLAYGQPKGELLAYEEFHPVADASAGYQFLRAGMEVTTLSTGRGGFLARILCGNTKATAQSSSQKKYAALLLDLGFDTSSHPQCFYASMRDIEV